MAVNSSGEILVADNGAKCVFVFYPVGKLRMKLPSMVSSCTSNESSNASAESQKPTTKKHYDVINALGVGERDEIIVADSSIHIFSKEGEHIRDIPCASSAKGHYGGVVYDSKGFLLASRIEKTKSFIQVFDYASGKLQFIIDSNDAKLRRPSCLVTTGDYHVIIADLGNDCIKKYRYH